MQRGQFVSAVSVVVTYTCISGVIVSDGSSSVPGIRQEVVRKLLIKAA